VSRSVWINGFTLFIFRIIWVINFVKYSSGFPHFVNYVIILYGLWRKEMYVKVSIIISVYKM